ncbi:uncharacterized protein CLUP02_01763 [Colletotrichum lupini]|uniref:Uncharacterized protein n=1 Tax=Colletotrichum lupini TaxID=145971 RepID=A0A9Q8WA85_9PEZI|nr:uncharacterized protein CLUP02_01763 [Colletotrichum lupini]UQC75110.1 hypothetical protein CLUP02_01763 [Colletotrichum lupini]
MVFLSFQPLITGHIPTIALLSSAWSPACSPWLSGLETCEAQESRDQLCPAPSPGSKDCVALGAVDDPAAGRIGTGWKTAGGINHDGSRSIPKVFTHYQRWRLLYLVKIRSALLVGTSQMPIGNVPAVRFREIFTFEACRTYYRRRFVPRSLLRDQRQHGRDMRYFGRSSDSRELINQSPQLARDILLSQEGLAAKEIAFPFASVVAHWRTTKFWGKHPNFISPLSFLETLDLRPGFDETGIERRRARLGSDSQLKLYIMSPTYISGSILLNISTQYIINITTPKRCKSHSKTSRWLQTNRISHFKQNLTWPLSQNHQNTKSVQNKTEQMQKNSSQPNVWTLTTEELPEVGSNHQPPD